MDEKIAKELRYIRYTLAGILALLFIQFVSIEVFVFGSLIVGSLYIALQTFSYLVDKRVKSKLGHSMSADE